MTIGLTWRRTARRIKRLKEGVLTISPDYSNRPTPDFLALSDLEFKPVHCWPPFYPRYFGYYERAITIYTHTSDQYSVFGTRVISCSPSEALYVLDGLLENDTVLRPREHYTDTHGFTEQLFGLCFLLGYSFIPAAARSGGPTTLQN